MDIRNVNLDNIVAAGRLHDLIDPADEQKWSAFFAEVLGVCDSAGWDAGDATTLWRAGIAFRNTCRKTGVYEL